MDAATAERGNKNQTNATTTIDTAGSTTSFAAGETCTYLSPSRSSGCRMPRSCQSCLATSGCYIDAGGSCASPQDEALQPTLDFRIAQTNGLVLPNATASNAAKSATQMWQFPAGQVAYCSLSDAVCSACRTANFWRSRNAYPDSRYCVGDGGCVCIDVCERRWYVQPDCSLGNGGVAPSPKTTMPTLMMGSPDIVNRVWQAMVGAVVFVVVIVAAMLRSKRRSEAATRRWADERQQQAGAHQERRHARAAELGVNPLTLTGWETYRRDLIEKETAQLSGAHDTKTTEGEADTVGHGETPVGAISEEHEIAYIRMAEADEDEEARASRTETSAAASGDDADDAAPAAGHSGPTEHPASALAPLSTTRSLLPERVQRGRARRGY